MALLIKEMDLTGEWAVNSSHRSPGIKVRNILQHDVERRSVEANVTAFDGSSFYSPPHRHNFDQVRIQLEGEMGYGGRHRLKKRMVGYFPEGTWYGPMTCDGPSISTIIQFDGASHGGYVTLNRMDAATHLLQKEGRFEKGFYYPDGGSKIDGYQASWERATGRNMVYVDPPRFVEAIYMNIDAFAWLPQADGTSLKTLGRFGERDLSIEALLVPKGRSTIIDKPGRRVVCFLLSGSIEIAGVQLPKWSGAYAEEADTVALTGVDEQSEVLVFTLPDLN